MVVVVTTETVIGCLLLIRSVPLEVLCPQLEQAASSAYNYPTLLLEFFPPFLSPLFLSSPFSRYTGSTLVCYIYLSLIVTCLLLSRLE